MKRRVVVTGIGTVSPLGRQVESLWQNILAGKSGIGTICSFDPIDYKVKFAGEIRDDGVVCARADGVFIRPRPD